MSNDHQEITYKVRGEVTVRLVGKDGQVKYEETKKNLVVNGGRTLVARRFLYSATLSVSSSSVFDPICRYIALGTLATAVSGSQTALSAITSGSNALNPGRLYHPSPSLGITGTGQSTMQWVKTWSTTEFSANIREAGLFNSPAHSMLSRVVFGSTITKTKSDTLQIRWQINITS